MLDVTIAPPVLWTQRLHARRRAALKCWYPQILQQQQNCLRPVAILVVAMRWRCLLKVLHCLLKPHICVFLFCSFCQEFDASAVQEPQEPAYRAAAANVVNIHPLARTFEGLVPVSLDAPPPRPRRKGKQVTPKHTVKSDPAPQCRSLDQTPHAAHSRGDI